MNTYDRIFGAGPKGAVISILLLVVAYGLEHIVALPAITANHVVRYSIYGVFAFIGIAIIIWSLKSLPPKERGKNLVTTGAFKYFRHPLYAAFLSFFNVGFAVLMNNWIYLLWALLILPLWHLTIRREEALMVREFGDDYVKYCEKTGRFFIKFGFFTKRD